MAKASKKDVVRALLDRYGTTYAEEIGVNLSRPTPSNLFKLLVGSLLFSARISEQISVEAAKGLFRRGWTTAEKMAGSTWKQRVGALNDAGYARYQERTATMLGDASELLAERYGGDLRKLRDEAERDPDRERKLLKQVKGIGDVGVDIFFREAQAVWEELFPFADRRTLAPARRLGLGNDARALARLVERKDFVRLTAALVRCGLDDGYEEIRDAARA